MPLVRSRAIALGALAAVFTALSLAHSALAFWSLDPASPLAICSAVKAQVGPSACMDGAAGMIVVWEDHRDSLTTDSDIYAQRITSDGLVQPGWPVNGFPVCNLAGAQNSPRLISDGVGGALVTWRDQRVSTPAIYIQHVLGTGVVDPAWPANGRLVCTAANGRNVPTLVSDGAGGAVLAWNDARDSLAGSMDIYADHVLASGAVDPAWPANGLLVCNSAGFKYFYFTMISDGAGGALLTWGDHRGADWDLYASHVQSGGTLDPAVPVNGTPVSVFVSDQIYPAICSDGGQGAYLTWTDFRSGNVYATRLKHNGTIFAAWPAGGIAVCPGPASFQYLSEIVSDGATGAIVAWDDFRATGEAQVFAQHVITGATVDPAWPVNGVQVSSSSGSNNVDAMAPDGAGGTFITVQNYPDASSYFPDYLTASHLLANGTLDPAWPSIGRPFDTATGAQFYTQIVSDGAGGIDVAWEHGHPLAAYNDDIDGTRIAYNGLIAPEPTIQSVSDVRGDQGGHITVRWNASWTDTLPTLPVTDYVLWRKLTGTQAQQAIARGVKTLRVTQDAGTPIYWQYEVTVPAHAFTGYAYGLATDADSSTSGIPWEVFMIQADLASQAPFYSSGQDSGYSVDNIPPAMPNPFTATYAGGTAYLHWGPNFEPDLAGYDLYRGTSVGFVPGPGNRVVAQPDTGYTDVAGAPYFYKLSAVDIHGNQSLYAFVQPTGTADVPAERASFALPPVQPNPAPGDRLIARFSLPDDAPARLELFDVDGRLAAFKSVGSLGAGPHGVNLSAGRKLAPGLYLVRLTQHGLTRSTRVTVLE